MRGKIKMRAKIVFRAYESEDTAYEQFWRANGYTSKSEFVRCSSNAAMLKQIHQLNSLMMTEKHMIERNIHLGRISSVLVELLTRAANDNSAENVDLETSLRAALNDIKVLRKKEP